jgi:predicted AAA+ superfamily ATPase
MSRPEIARTAYLAEISRRFESSPVVALLGARQVGKSTLARRFAAEFDGPVH